MHAQMILLAALTFINFVLFLQLERSSNARLAAIYDHQQALAQELRKIKTEMGKAAL